MAVSAPRTSVQRASPKAFISNLVIDHGPSGLLGPFFIHADAACRAAGVPFVAVGFGFSDRPVEALGADAVIDDYGALVPALARL